MPQTSDSDKIKMKEEFTKLVQTTREGLVDLLQTAEQKFPLPVCRDYLTTARNAVIDVGCSFKGSLDDYKRFAKEARALGFDFSDVPTGEDKDFPIGTEDTPADREKLTAAINILDAYLSVQKLREQLKQYRLLALADQTMRRI